MKLFLNEEKTKLAMISQPMKDKTEEEILSEKERATKILMDMGYEVCDSYFNFDEDELKASGVDNISIYYLAKSLEKMSGCSALFRCNGWDTTNGCKVESMVAELYGLKLIDDEPVITNEKLNLLEYDEDKIQVANKTARKKGASVMGPDGTLRSIVARYILNNISKDCSILDFGAGVAAVQTLALRDQGFKNVTAYDFGDNVIEGVHDKDALQKTYDVVFASNVLNVSSDEEMLRETLRDIWKATKDTCVFNYPGSPRKANLTAHEVEEIIEDELGVEPQLVGGTKSVPVWRIDKNA